MMLWTKLIELDGRLRRFVALYIFIPLAALSVPVGLCVLLQSSRDYHRLAEAPVHTLAVIQSIAETGGRHNRNAVTSTFKAADGRTYVSKALYGIEGSRHLRPGMKLGVVYERDLPSNNAPTLAYAQAQTRDAMVFIAIMSGIFILLAWIYRQDYAAMFRRLRGDLGSRAASPACTRSS